MPGPIRPARKHHCTHGLRTDKPKLQAVAQSMIFSTSLPSKRQCQETSSIRCWLQAECQGNLRALLQTSDPAALKLLSQPWAWWFLFDFFIPRISMYIVFELNTQAFWLTTDLLQFFCTTLLVIRPQTRRTWMSSSRFHSKINHLRELSWIYWLFRVHQTNPSFVLPLSPKRLL